VAAAAASDREHASGRDRSDLHIIPCLVKSSSSQFDFSTNMESALSSKDHEEWDSQVVKEGYMYVKRPPGAKWSKLWVSREAISEPD
jgi:hypothetical protein